MDLTDIKTKILAGSNPEQMESLCNIAEDMFFAIALVDGYSTDPELRSFGNFFNELSALGSAAVRQVKAEEMANERQLTARDHAIAASIDLARRVRFEEPSPAEAITPPKLERQTAVCPDAPAREARRNLSHEELCEARESFNHTYNELEAADDL